MKSPGYKSLFPFLLILLAGCAGIQRSASWYNPLAIPGKSLGEVGFVGADSGFFLVRESGRLLQSLGTLLEAPALLTEGLVTLNTGKIAGGSEGLITGSGTTVTGVWNLPFCFMPGRNLDLARDVELVQQALAFLEDVPVEKWRDYPGDKRTFIFPKGTRVRASGQNLIYTIPGYGEVIQAGETSMLWDLLQAACGTDFPAQERSWGFVGRNPDNWDHYHKGFRARVILHELYHQQMQMRDWLKGWSLVYWPAYIATFPFTGWSGHWAEQKGVHAAGVVDSALNHWRIE